MSTASLRRHRFGGLPLSTRTIVLLERFGITPATLPECTSKQLLNFGLTEDEVRIALQVAQKVKKS